MELLTIGHSTSPLDHFIEQLDAAEVRVLADVRRFPASRRYPHFNREALQASLPAHGIGYEWYESLGGRRKVRPDSKNGGWENLSFRGYADYMESPEFEEAAQTLMERAASVRTAVMCAEAQWWRCHRRLISDYFVVHGWDVGHIMGSSIAPHKLLPPARLEEGELTYPPAPSAQITLPGV